MARCTPFVRCRYVQATNVNNDTQTVVYLINIAGHAESIATVTNRQTDLARYRAHDDFIEQYGYLHGNSPNEWIFKDEFQNWIGKLQYYSFVEQQLPMAQPCWFFKRITDDTPFTNHNLRIPDNLNRVLQADTNVTWILLKNQAKVWPIQIVGNRFGIGWEEFYIDNCLISDYQIILASETSCIFEVLIFNKEHIGVFNMYSNENALPPPFYLLPAVLQTSCFPTIWFDRKTIAEFTIDCDIDADIVQSFQAHLEPLFEHNGEQQIVFALQQHEWTIPVIDGVMNTEALEDFISELELFIGHFIAVLMTKELLTKVIVFDGEGGEKIFPWYQNYLM